LNDITHDPAYQTVDRDDFPAMIAVPRYGLRSDAFDEIIARTADHFWDPGDAAYVDFDQPFDLDREALLPPEQYAEMHSAVADRLDEGQRIRFANELTRFTLSNVLHGEQGALSLSASLCHILLDPGAQEYAANQAREEARHVHAFTRYVAVRFGEALPAGSLVQSFMTDLVRTPVVYKKLIGMQMLLEGLAMGLFAGIHARTKDPVLRRLVQLVMTDEAFHHRFGRIWAERTVPELSEEEHIRVEDWAAESFQTLLFNLLSPEQKRHIYPQFGLDWEWVRDAVRESFTDDVRRQTLRSSTSPFRMLVKTLLSAGIITERTRETYAQWVDLAELQADHGRWVADEIADEALVDLRELNRQRSKIGATAL